MWFKYFNKESWGLRIFRKQNLKFLQDDYGLMRHKTVHRWKDFLFRATRNEANLRAGILAISIGVIPILVMLKTQYYDPVYIAPKKIESDRILKEKDEEARQVLFYNRYGAPTRPLRSLDDMIAFLGGSETYAQLADFNSYGVSSDINADQQAGLDSWMSEDDAKMMLYYKESLKHGGGH